MQRAAARDLLRAMLKRLRSAGLSSPWKFLSPFTSRCAQKLLAFTRADVLLGRCYVEVAAPYGEDA